MKNIDIFDFKLTDEEINQIRQLDKNDIYFHGQKVFKNKEKKNERRYKNI